MKRKGSQDIENNRHVKKRKMNEITSPSREGEEAFFSVMNDSDLWTEFKKYMYPKNVKTYNYYEYKNGDLAAYHGYLGLIKEKHNDMAFTEDAINLAAARGHLEIVRFLHEHREEGCGAAAMDFAALNGHSKIVRFLHEHRKEGCTNRAMDWAALNGYFEIVRFLHEHRKEGCTIIAIS